MNNYKCPICDKPGLEDFRKNETTCPNCDTDLSVFVDLKQTASKGYKFKFLLVVLLCVFIPIIFLIIITLSNTKKELNNSLTQNKQLTTSLASKATIIVQLEASIKSIQQVKVVEQEIVGNFYFVKRGDSFCSISYLLFGTEKYAKEIAELNGKDLTSIIFPGTKFIIPQK